MRSDPYERASQHLLCLLLVLSAVCCSKPRAPSSREATRSRSAQQRATESSRARTVEDGAASSASAPPALGCLAARPSTVSGRVAARELDEISGIVASRAQPGIYWVHNDSGDSARVFAIDERGGLLLELTLTGVTAHDVEDIALLPSPRGDMLYLADVGDNLETRAHVRIFRVAAPTVAPSTPGQKLSREPDTIQVGYDDGPHNVETLLADPRSGDLFLVEKGPLLARRHPVGVYRIEAAELLRPSARARRVVTVPLGPTTAGDVLADGSGIAIRNYTHARFWPRAQGETIVEALAGAGCDLPLADVGEQGEALAFDAEGSAYLSIAEGAEPPIHRTPFTRAAP